MLLRQPWLLVFGNVGLSDTASFRPISLWWKVRGRGVLRPYRPGTPGPCGRAARRASSGCARCRSTTAPAAAATLGPAHDGQTREPRAPAGPHFAACPLPRGPRRGTRRPLPTPPRATFLLRGLLFSSLSILFSLPFMAGAPQITRYTLSARFPSKCPSWPGVLRGRESFVAGSPWLPGRLTPLRPSSYLFGNILGGSLSAQRLASRCNGRSRCSMLTVLSTAWGAPFGMRQEPGGQLRLTAYPPTQCTKKV